MADRDDEWWTLSEVCAFLKVHRATIHRLRRSRNAAFPPGAMFAKGVLRFRIAAVRNWAATRESRDAAMADAVGAKSFDGNMTALGAAASRPESVDADLAMHADARKVEAPLKSIVSKSKRRGRRSREANEGQLNLF